MIQAIQTNANTNMQVCKHIVCEVQYVRFVMLHLRVCWGDGVVMSGVVCGC